ncbi:hypothetical protein AtNW77_Chr1g0046751 [Arabidopsis thaliana]
MIFVVDFFCLIKKKPKHDKRCVYVFFFTLDISHMKNVGTTLAMAHLTQIFKDIFDKISSA